MMTVPRCRVTPPVENKKMTRAQRNRQARRLRNEEIRAEKLKKKMFRKELANAASIAKEIDLHAAACSKKKKRIE